MYSIRGRNNLKKLIYIFFLIPSILFAQRDIDGRRIKNATLDTAALKQSSMNWIKYEGQRAIKLVDFGVTVNDSTKYDDNRTAFWNAMAYADSENIKNIEFPSGNIWIDSITVKHDSLNFIGTGGTWLVYKGSDQGTSAHVRFIVLSKRKDIRIDGINFKMYNSRQTPYQVFPIFIYNAEGESGYAENISVQHCIFEDFGSIYPGGGYTDTVAIGLEFCFNTFRNNTIVASAFYAGRATDLFAGTFQSKFNYNYFYGNWKINAAFRGDFDDCQFIGNYIEKSEDSAIYIRGDNNIVSFNQIYYAGKDGIKVLETDVSPYTEGKGNIIIGNQVHGAGATDGKDSATMIKAEGMHSIVTNNIVFAVDTTGISPKWSTLDQKGFQCRGDSMVLSDNYAYGGYSKGYPSYSGIRITGNSNHAIIKNNTVVNWEYGLASTYGDDWVIEGNIFKDSGNKGLLINSYDAADTCLRIVIKDNVFYNGASDDISIRYIDTLIISGNVSFGRQADDFLDIANCDVIKYTGMNVDTKSSTPPTLSSFTVPVGDSISIGGARFFIEQDTAYILGIGYEALLTRASTLKYTNLLGYRSGYAATGTGLSGIGHQIFQTSSSSYSEGFGYRNSQNATADYSSAIGYMAGMYNDGDYSQLIGHYAGRWNKGSYSQGIGNQALYFNTGSYCFAGGGLALNRNEGNYNTAVGYTSFNTFNENVSGAKTFGYTDIVSVSGSDTITITSHGFGSADAQVNLKFTQGTSAITGLTNGTVYTWKVIDANTICGGFTQNITAAGTGTGHTMTPQTSLTNSTALGYNAEPDASNQVMFGDANVTSVKSAGAFTSTSTSTNTFPKLAATDSLQVGSDKWIRKVFQSAGGDSLGFIYYNTVRSRIDTVYIVQ